MGFIRGFLVVVISVLLFLSLLSMTLLGVLSSSLNYETLQQKSSGVIEDSLESQFNLSSNLNSFIPIMQLYCINNSVSDYVFNTGGYTFDIPCTTVIQGKDAIIDESISDLIHNVYYTKYDCSFIDCVIESPFALVSEKAYNYLNGKFYFFLLASFLLTAALFFFVEKKTNTFIIAGSMMTISSLIFFKLDSIFALFPEQILFKLLGIFFSESFSFSVKILIAGIVLLIIGIIMKIFKLGFKIEQFISKLKQAKKVQPSQNQPAKKSRKRRRN